MRRGKDEAQRWITQAQIDLEWAERIASEGGHHIACFLAQQVAEKALKAFLYWCGEEFVIGHSVVKLCKWCAQHDEDFKEKEKKWAFLDTFYIPTRYPNGIPDGIPAEVYNEKTAMEAVDAAREVVSFVLSKLKEG